MDSIYSKSIKIEGGFSMLYTVKEVAEKYNISPHALHNCSDQDLITDVKGMKIIGDYLMK